MFAPRRSPVGRSEGQNPRFKDVVFCESSSFPLAVPSALIATIWDQVSEGLRAVPRGGAEVGGLILGRRSPAIIQAESLVPIPIEYYFGPSFRLSDSDLKTLEELMASLQKDPSNVIVGFYRSRTRNDSLSEESESAVLTALQQAHTSFASDFHYYVVFTPTSRTTMTASASFRKDEGWDDWQHVTLVVNFRSAQPIEFPPPKTPQAPGSQVAQPAARTAPPPPAESQPLPVAEPSPEQQPEPPPIQTAEPRILPAAETETHVSQPTAELYSRPLEGWALAEPLADNPPEGKGRSRLLWYAAIAVLLAAIALGTYLRIGPASLSQAPLSSALSTTPQPATLPVTEVKSTAAPAPAAVSTGFLASREGSGWKLTWDPAAVGALHPVGAVLSIRDGSNKQQMNLTPSDLTGANIFYTPHSNDLLFSLNIVVPGGQSVEEHVRVLQAFRTVEVPAESTPKTVASDPVRTLRPFTPTPIRPKDSVAGNPAVAEVPPPPALATAGSNQPLSSVLPVTVAAPAPLPIPTVAKPASGPQTAPAPARPDFAKQLVGSWAATFSQSSFPTETATISVSIYANVVNGWFLGKYKLPRNAPPIKQPVSLQFQGALDKAGLPDGAWVFPFKSAEGLQGTIRLRPQGNALDVTWNASLPNGKTYTFEHVMGREGGAN